MRRASRVSGGTAFANKAKAASNPDISVLRTFISETNPARPLRPSPLAASQISGMPLDMLDRIRSFPLFQSAPESFLAAIGAHLRPQVHNPHDYVLTEGDEAKAMYWLVRGAVAVTSRDGESVYAELKPGAFFGEIGVLMGIPRTATIIARSRCLSVVLKKEDLMKELPKFPEVERAIREEAMERLAILERKKEESKRSKQPTAVPFRSSSKRPREDSDDEGAQDRFGRTSGEAPNKKRKSPSPKLADVAASSALGSGSVSVRQLLKVFPLFSSLPVEILHFLGLNAQPRTYPPFSDIIHQNSQGREVYFIVRGEVEVLSSTHAADGPLGEEKIVVKARLRQGQYFGEVASLSLAPRRTATVRSVTMVECLMLDGDVLTQFWNRCPLNVRQQIEETAKERLESARFEDTDTETTHKIGQSHPTIGKLVLGGDGSKPPLPENVPKLTFSFETANGSHLSTDEHSVAEPLDPDPFLNVELDNIRIRSRRSSLAPPSPDSSSSTSFDSEKRSPSPDMRQHSLSPARPKHGISPSGTMKSKRHKPSRTSSMRVFNLPLSDKIILNIFGNLDVYELMRMRCVSSHWANLCKSEQLLHFLDLSKYNRKVTDAALINYIIPFVGCRPTFIDISNCFHMTDEGFYALVTQCACNVKCFKMQSVWDVTALAILEMSNNAKGLRQIDLSNCRKVTDNLMMRIVGYVVPFPTSPKQRSQARLTNTKNQQQDPPPGTVMGCPQLKSLTLSYCKHITDRFMHHVAAHAASRIEHMDLTRCTTITDVGFQYWSHAQFTNLRKLCLADCTYLTDNAIVYLANAAKNLRELDLSFCCALSDASTEVLALGCPSLTHLSMAFCGSAVSDPSLRSIGLHLVHLRELCVRGCVRVTGVGIEAVLDGCRDLSFCDVSQCKNLSPWLDIGGPGRWPCVQFETVAGEMKSSHFKIA